MNNDTITEWQILFSLGSGKEDFYTENELEYEEYFEELRENGELDLIDQCIRKDYIWNEETETWDEDWVEVLFDNINNTETLDENLDIDTTYIVGSYYDEKLRGLEDELKTDDWSEVEDFAHRKLMQGNMLEIENTKTGKYRRINPDEYNEKFDGEFIVRPEELEEAKDTTINNKSIIKSYNETDYGWHNNATTLYGELLDGNWYSYVPDNESIEIYNAPITNKYIDTAYNYQTDDERADDEWFDKFQQEHNITNQYTQKEIFNLIDELDARYFNKSVEENKKIEERYNIYTISEDGYNIYNSHKVDTVDTLEQAEDRVSELKAETGMNAYYEKVDEWWETNSKRLIDYVNQETPEAIADLVYNGNIAEYMDNTSKQIALDIYNQLGKEVTENLLNNKIVEDKTKVSTAADKMATKNYHNMLKKELLKVQREIENAGPGDISVLENKRDFIMNKLDNIELGNPRLIKEESKTNWKSQIKDIFKDMYEVGKPVDPDDIDRFVTELIDEEHIGSNDIREEMQDYCLELLDNFNDLDMVEESKQPAYRGKDLSDFKLMLKAFDNNGRHAQRGNWEIGRGGYDMWYEIYYNKVPVIRCINGNVEVETEGYEDYAKLTAEQYGDTYIDTLTEGKVTTTSGTYDTKKYDEICNKVKQAYKDAWEGKISYSDLEDIKKNSGLSNGELSSIQYSASRETDKKEENKSLSTLKTKLTDKVNKVLQKPEYGFDKDEIKDYIVVEVNKTNDEEIKVEVRAELDYEAFNKLIDELDPIIQAYDNNSYFDMEDTGIAVAYINNKSKKITECDDEEYSDETNWAEEEASEADERFENRYMNGGNGATFTKRKTESVADNKETVNPEEVKEEVEQDKQETGIKGDIDTEEEAKTAVKKEVYQYAKQQGLDIEKLRKQGIELSEVAELLDKVVGNMVSKSIIEYEDKTGKSVTWDYDVTNNDIDIVITEL